MASPIYFPTLWGRAGEIEAISRLNPRTRELVRPILDFPRQKEADKRPLAGYLRDKVREIASSWGTADEIYFDFTRYEPALLLSTGDHFVDYVFEVARQARVKVVPVGGPPSVRGPGHQYIDAVANAAKKCGRGIAIRIPAEDFLTEDSLLASLTETLSAISVPKDEVDLILDAGALSVGPFSTLEESDFMAVLRQAATIGLSQKFRHLVLLGSNLPDSLVRHRRGEVLRSKRKEFAAWKLLVKDDALAAIQFGDYGVIHPHYVAPVGRVIPPCRVRSTTEEEYLLRKLGRHEIRKLSKAAMDEGDLDSDVDSWGRDEVRECAAGYGDPGAPKNWIGRDTNRHIEGTVAAIRKVRGVSGGSESGGIKSPWRQQPILL